MASSFDIEKIYEGIRKEVIAANEAVIKKALTDAGLTKGDDAEKVGKELGENKDLQTLLGGLFFAALKAKLEEKDWVKNNIKDEDKHQFFQQGLNEVIIPRITKAIAAKVPLLNALPEITDDIKTLDTLSLTEEQYAKFKDLHGIKTEEQKAKDVLPVLKKVWQEYLTAQFSGSNQFEAALSLIDDFEEHIEDESKDKEVVELKNTLSVEKIIALVKKNESKQDGGNWCEAVVENIVKKENLWGNFLEKYGSTEKEKATVFETIEKCFKKTYKVKNSTYKKGESFSVVTDIMTSRFDRYAKNGKVDATINDALCHNKEENEEGYAKIFSETEQLLLCFVMSFVSATSFHKLLNGNESKDEQLPKELPESLTKIFDEESLNKIFGEQDVNEDGLPNIFEKYVDSTFFAEEIKNGELKDVLSVEGFPFSSSALSDIIKGVTI